MTKINTNNTILVPIDFSEISLNALKHALEVAKKYQHDITLLHIEGKTENADNELIALAKSNSVAGSVRINTLMKEGKVAETIHNVAENDHYEMIAMGSHGASGWKSLMGSNASKVLKSATCPVMVVKENTPFTAYKNIVMPIDLSIESKQKVNWAIHLAQKFDATIHIIYEEQSDEYLQIGIKGNINQVADVLKDNNVKYDLHQMDKKTYPGKLYEDALQYADATQADLVLVVSHPEDKILDYVFNSEAEKIVNKSKRVTVMVVNPSQIGYTVGSPTFTGE